MSRDWTPGSPGKGVQDRTTGELHTWNTDALGGTPYHADAIGDTGTLTSFPGKPSDAPACNPINIRPDGTLDTSRKMFPQEYEPDLWPSIFDRDGRLDRCAPPLYPDYADLYKA